MDTWMIGNKVFKILFFRSRVSRKDWWNQTSAMFAVSWAAKTSKREKRLQFIFSTKHLGSQQHEKKFLKAWTSDCQYFMKLLINKKRRHFFGLQPVAAFSTIFLPSSFLVMKVTSAENA
jgi:hypothetical protein